MAVIETLVQDIYNLFDGENIDFSDRRVADFGHAMAAHVTNRLSEERGSSSFRMSNIGATCDRKLWYDINSPEKPEALPPETKVKFLFGDILEELLLFLAEQAGHTVEGRQDELEINGVLGHRDAIIDGVTVDCKSASTFSFAKFAAGLTPDNDSFGYLDQLNAYIHAGQSDPLVVDKNRGAFLVIDKTLGKICLDVHQYRTVDYSSLIQYKKAIYSSETPPPRAFDPVPDGKSGNMKLGTVCSYCHRKDECRPGLRKFIYSNGPRWLTKVARVPDVPEV